MRKHDTRSWLPLLLLLAALGCGQYGGGSEASGAVASDDGGTTSETPSGGSVDPTASVAAFGATVYPLLRDYCSECHDGTDRSPHIAHPDVDTAYRAVVDNQKVNFATPGSSRLVRRLAADFHHCWSNCMEDALVMEAAIMAWADAIQQSGGGSTTLNSALASEALTLADGREDLGDERYLDHVVALWDFKEGSGPVAHDVSPLAPAMDLSLDGPTWMSSYGIAIDEGRAEASAATSRKFYDRVAAPEGGTQQYSVEAWVVPENVTQEGPARIVSYSRGTNSRNFTLGQVLYTYDFRNRSMNPEISDNGSPSLRTYDADEDLQATLQHVVITYDQFRGRRIYVNGRFTDDLDEFDPSRLWNWDPDHRFVLGNETTGDRQWKGQIRLVALYDHALTDAQIQQNFSAGVGKRLLMRFDVSRWVGAGNFIEFTVTEFDAYSYLFCEPTFVTPNPNGFRVSNLRVAVNGQIPVSGQAFVNLDAVVTGSRQKLSSLCSIVPKDQGSTGDVFTIEFEVLAGFENPVVVPPLPTPPPPVFGAALPGEGIRDFSRINESMAVLTGVDPATAAVRSTFSDLEQQLPGGADLRAFSSSHQVGIAKLALEYCDQLVESPALRTGFFGPDVDFNAPATTAFADAAGRDAVIGPLVARLLGTDLGQQPSEAEVAPLLNELFDELTLGCTAATCPAERTRTVVKAACAAVLGSAAVSIH